MATISFELTIRAPFRALTRTLSEAALIASEIVYSSRELESVIPLEIKLI